MAPKRIYFEAGQICVAPASGFTKFEKEHVAHTNNIMINSYIQIAAIFCSCSVAPDVHDEACPNYKK